MSVIIDTIVWLVNFPAQNGFPMVFIAAFGAMGLVRMASKRSDGDSPHLQGLREQAGMATAVEARPMRRLFGRIQRWTYGIAAGIVIGAGLIGLLSITGVDITEPYIAANGVTTEATLDDDLVTFMTDAGVEYTLPVSFFTRPTYPDPYASIGWDDTVTVTYLASHPQAFVINTDG